MPCLDMNEAPEPGTEAPGRNPDPAAVRTRIREGPGYAGGYVLYAYFDEDSWPVGELWVRGGRAKLLEVREAHRRRGVASALLDEAVRIEGEELVYELDPCEPDGYVFLEAWEARRGVRLARSSPADDPAESAALSDVGP